MLVLMLLIGFAMVGWVYSWVLGLMLEDGGVLVATSPSAGQIRSGGRGRR
jgi:hypothetical protein